MASHVVPQIGVVSPLKFATAHPGGHGMSSDGTGAPEKCVPQCSHECVQHPGVWQMHVGNKNCPAAMPKKSASKNSGATFMVLVFRFSFSALFFRHHPLRRKEEKRLHIYHRGVLSLDFFRGAKKFSLLSSFLLTLFGAGPIFGSGQYAPGTPKSRSLL